MPSSGRNREQASYGRRDFLRNSAAAALLLGGGAALLEACGGGSDPITGATNTTKPGAGGTTPQSACGQAAKLSRPNDPAILPFCGDPIADGLDPEKGTLKVFNYADYVGPDLLKAFEKEYGVKVQVTQFESMDDAVNKLQSKVANFDISNVSPDRLGSLVATSSLQPINHSYVPNLKNAWASVQDPFYDKGSRYSVPYTAYTTGIGYRVDKIDPADDPYKLAEGTDLFFKSKYKGRVWILDDSREALSMALLRLGYTDVNTEDPKQVSAARKELQKLIGLVNVKIGIDDYTKLPEGQAWVYQAWGPDMINAVSNLPEGVGPEVLGYWVQPNGKALIQNDTMTIPKNAAHPVLAHHFLNFILDPKNAMLNYDGTGYPQPLTALTKQSFIDRGLPKNLEHAIVVESDFDKGYEELQLSPAGDRLWQSEWATFTSGA